MSDPPSIRATSVTIGAPDPRALAAFYARLLGVEVSTTEGPDAGDPPEAGWAQVRTEELTLNVEYEKHWRAPVWPARDGEPVATVHLDLWVHDLEAALAWAVACGGRPAQVQPQDAVRVVIDPAGHPFCLFV